MIVGYLINVYPLTNQTFIRREIAALEAQRITVRRYALRPCHNAVDAADAAEKSKTRFVLTDGKIALAWGVLTTLLSRPLAALHALRIACQIGWPSDRGVIRHVIYWAEACVLRRWMADAKVEHLHAHYGTNTAAIALLARLLGGPPYSFTAHGPEEFDRPQQLSLGEKIRHASFVVAISEFGRSQLFRWCRHEHWDKIKIVGCGVDATFLEAPSTPVPSARRLLSVGRLAEQKGQLLLVEAAAILAKRGLDFELQVVGDGEMADQIRQFIKHHRLETRVKLLGWKNTSEIRTLMLESRALVMPSFAEGLPVVIMESLALERPVVSTCIAGIPELVENNISGFLVPAGSVEPLVAAMADVLLSDPADLWRLGRAGAARVRLRHDASAEAARLATLIEESVRREKAQTPRDAANELATAGVTADLQSAEA